MIEMFSYPFMQRALIAGVLIGFLASYYGVFIVQRKMSFLGSGLAHAAFGGVALGLLLNTEPLWIAVPFTILVGILIIYLKEKTNLGADTSIGILFSISVAMGIIFLAMRKSYSADAYSYLFGSILSVFPNDLIIASVLTLITLFTFKKLWSRWAYATFDSELALSDKVNVLRDDYILSILISTTIVVSIKIVGIVLISAFVVIPAASAKMLASSFIKMTIYAIIFGILSSIFGLIISFYFDIPSGATIIILQSIIFIITALIKNAALN